METLYTHACCSSVAGWRTIRPVLLAFCLFVALLAALPAATGAGKSDTTDLRFDDALSVDPGTVRFYLSKTGSWLGLVPSWAPGESVFLRGGFSLFAEDDDGTMVQVVGLTTTKPEFVRGTFSCEGMCEGIAGGCRRPAPHPDDDDDGVADEDRLDGIDNDGDGRIDEDFRAIGDNMTVVESVFEPADSGGALVFHQESYAWSLPHIENMVVVSLTVTNSGGAVLRNVRLGASLEAEGPLECSASTIESPGRRGQKPATVLQCGGGNEGTFALALLAHNAGREEPWLHGVTDPAEDLAAVIARSGAEPAERFESDRDSDRPAKPAVIAAGARAVVYGISPAVSRLAPGEEMRIDVALIATKSADKMESAIIDAYKTYTGDGTNHFLPPPMSLTRRVLWGRFEPLEAPQEGLLITIENARAEGLYPERLSFLGCIPVEEIEIVDADGRDLVFIYRGAIDDGARDPAGRIILMGRVQSGAIYEITLRPVGEPHRRDDLTGRARRLAEEYWQHPGKLNEELLSNSPNPFRESTVIFYEVPSEVEDENGGQIANEGPFETSVKVYNVTGQLVSILADWVMGPGRYSAEWNGLDDNGNPVASGVYYVKLQIEKRHITKRLTLVR